MTSPKYLRYRSSGVPWLGEIPEHWAVFPLKAIASGLGGAFIDGDWIESRHLAETGVRYITTGNVGAGFYKEQGTGYISDETFTELGCTEVQPNDVLISRLNAPIGRACLVPDLGARVVTSVDNVIMRPSQEFDRRYLVFRLSSPDYLHEAGTIASGATMQRISRSELGNLRIAFPPLDEQVSIAAFLDYETAKIDALIAEQEKLIALLAEKRQATISHAVTRGLNPDAPMKDSGVPWLGEVPAHWDVVGLTKYLLSVVDYRGRTPTKVDDGVFLVTAKNIRDGQIDYETSQEFIEREEYEEVMRRGLPRRGDVLFTTEAPLGQVAQIDREDIALAQRVIKFRSDPERLLASFLMYWIMGESCQFDLLQLATGSTALGIKGSKVGLVRLCLPPLGEQAAIVEWIVQVVSALDRTRDAAIQAVELLRERRAALIAAAVTGQIDVRGFANQAAA